MAMFTDNTSAAEAVKIIFNGPALAGVGATTDAGLTPDKHHVLPWDPSHKSKVRVTDREDGTEVQYTMLEHGAVNKIAYTTALQYAIYNVDNIFDFENQIGSINAFEDNERMVLRRDMIAICYLMTAYNYYDTECRESTAAEKKTMSSITGAALMSQEVISKDAINRAATFILARMHTKYQTNHVLGGSPMQASIASAVRAFYDVNPATARNEAVKEKVRAIAKCLHWALHPANERLLIPAVISGTKMQQCTIHRDGPPLTVVGKEEYFTIRSRTPPASTHHFYVAASAVQHLRPLGILPYMQSKQQMDDIRTGWALIAAHGAALHPAARFWGLAHITANQKLVEPVCADLGYAVRKLMPGSSLAGSPILAKEDALDPSWKQFVDSLRQMMDQAGKDMMDSEVLNDIRKRIAPTAGDESGINAVSKLLITAPMAAPVADEEDGDHNDIEDHPESSDDEDPPAPPPAPHNPPAPDQGDGDVNNDNLPDSTDEDDSDDDAPPPAAPGAAVSHAQDDSGEPLNSRLGSQTERPRKAKITQSKGKAKAVETFRGPIKSN